MSKDCPLADTRVLDGRKQKISKIIMFDSQEYRQDRPQGLKKKTNIQEFRPGCSAMQLHCGLRLLFKKILTVRYCTYATVYGLLYIKISFYLLFGQMAQNCPV